VANVKITELPNLTDPSTTDVMPVVDVDADVTKKVSVGEIIGKISGDVNVATDGTSSIASGVIVDADINNSAEIAVSKLADGAARQLLQTDAAGTGVEWTDNVDVPGTLDVTGATTLDSTLGVNGQSTLASAAISDLTEDRVVVVGASGELEDSANLTFDGSELGITGTLDVSSDATVGGDLTVEGDLAVKGTTTTVETETLTVEDKNIELGVVGAPSDATADGGGITLKGATDKTINWFDATDAWTFSEHVDIASAKEFRIAGAKVLDATSLGSGVVSSSLTSVGTITTGAWQGTAIGDAYLDTISTAGKVSNSATTATDANTASAIVTRDASGNFSAGTITADLTGNAATATKLDSSRTFEVTGDVTGTVSSDLTSGASITTSIASGAIVDDNINTSAAIAGTKISPNFGSQAVATTGSISAGSASFASNVTLTGGTQSTSTAQARRFATSGLGTNTEGKLQQNTGFAAISLSSDNTAAGSSRVALNLGYDGSTVASFKYDGSASFASRILVGTLSQSGDSLLQIDDDRIRLATAKTPTSAADTGVTGEICWDADYVYVCIATDTWKRAGLSTW